MSDSEERKKRNEDLIARMRRGESLALIDQKATWWPRRPPKPKDKHALDVLFAPKEVGDPVPECEQPHLAMVDEDD